MGTSRAPRDSFHGGLTSTVRTAPPINISIGDKWIYFIRGSRTAPVIPDLGHNDSSGRCLRFSAMIPATRGGLEANFTQR